MMRVEVADRTEDHAVVWIAGPDPGRRGSTRSGPDSLGGYEVFLPGTELESFLAAPAGRVWAYEARRIAAGVPRIGRGHRSPAIPNELGCSARRCTWTRAATAARRPSPACTTWAARPDGWSGCTWTARSTRFPRVGAALTLDGRAVGFVGGSARHFELGPIALGLVKRNVDPGRGAAGRTGIAAAQELLVDPEVGLHVRPAAVTTPFAVDPILVEVVRNGTIESVHHGRVAVTAPDGTWSACWAPCSRRCIPAAAASPCRRSAWSGPDLDLPAGPARPGLRVPLRRAVPRRGRTADPGRPGLTRAPADPARLAGRRAGRHAIRAGGARPSP